jgi:hypothetical protein
MVAGRNRKGSEQPSRSFRYYRCRLRAKNVFGQIRTLELRNSARIVQKLLFGWM